jgi:hypothetical protein
MSVIKYMTKNDSDLLSQLNSMTIYDTFDSSLNYAILTIQQENDKLAEAKKKLNIDTSLNN